MEAGLGDARHQCREAEGKYHDSLFSYNKTPQIAVIYDRNLLAHIGGDWEVQCQGQTDW